jgi:hypothetical protein
VRLFLRHVFGVGDLRRYVAGGFRWSWTIRVACGIFGVWRVGIGDLEMAKGPVFFNFPQFPSIPTEPKI